MGLDIRCNCGAIDFRAGSYSGYVLWRKALAKIIDVDLDIMKGYGGVMPWGEDTPFLELLYHSDCDGILTPDECAELLDDFELWREVVEKEFDEYYLELYDKWEEAVRHSTEDECPVCGQNCNILFR